MGIDYSCSLVYGFEFDQKEVEGLFCKKNKDPGSFHMEDRFDAKTGAKVAPEKVWDKKPSTEKWYEIDGEKFDDIDSEEWEKILEEKLGCHVEMFGSWPSGELTYVFHINPSVGWKEADDYGKVTVYNNVIGQDELAEMMPEAMKLKSKLKEMGLNPPEPMIFIATRIS